jgi:hypothetical protein
MSDLMGNANINQGGAGVIKSIQVVKESVPTTGGKSFTITTVDPAKTVVMLYGNSFISDRIQRFFGTIDDNSEVTRDLSPSVDVDITEVKASGGGGYWSEGGAGYQNLIVCSYLSATQVKIKMGECYSPEVFNYAIEVIEHKSQTIYPVIVSIAATAIVIDWAKEPSVAADVSILVIEYI